MRLGLYGGSFDPIHIGHLLLAETCRESVGLDQIWFVPAAVSPHKQGQKPTDNQHRLQMLRLAIGGHSSFEVCDLELQRGGVSYTVDTLQAAHDQIPGLQLFFLMGADALADFPTWREPERICQLATLAVVHRPDSPTPDFAALDPFLSSSQRELVRQTQVEMPLIDISSREIRRRVAEGRGIRFRTPRAVEKYIETQGLYR